jgi:hypothetical protein
MGLETTSQPISIKRFLGLNNKYSDISTDPREASALQNVNITEHSVETRQGSTKKHTVAFKEKTDTTAKEITGLFEAKLDNTLYQVGIGGDAFKQYASNAWTDKTGAVTITDDEDIHWSFAKFKNASSTNDIIIAANGTNPPIKWTGSGNAAALTITGLPGNFNYPVVHKNKLWVAYKDILYWSGILDGESWTVATDLVRFENKGEYITGLAVFADRLIVFQESAIWSVSGSNYRDIFADRVISNDGTLSHWSIQEVSSRRYGNILIFLGKDGYLKGFNGSKNTVDLSDPAKPLMDGMNDDRRSKSVSANYTTRSQYWIALTTASTTQNNQIVVYDYANDAFSNAEGKALSSILYHTGIKANAMTTWKESGSDVLITGDYLGFALKQDSGQLDEGVTGINGFWQTRKLDFGSATTLKMLTDLSILTTQRTATNASVGVVTDLNSGSGTIALSATGAIWGEFNWGSENWSAPNIEYTRVELSNVDSSDEGSIFGRYFVVQINHNNASEQMITNELNIGITNLGYQPAYVEES